MVLSHFRTPLVKRSSVHRRLRLHGICLLRPMAAVPFAKNVSNFKGKGRDIGVLTAICISSGVVKFRWTVLI